MFVSPLSTLASHGMLSGNANAALVGKDRLSASSARATAKRASRRKHSWLFPLLKLYLGEMS